MLLLLLWRKGVLSPLAGLMKGAGEKLGLAEALLKGVLEWGTEYVTGTFFREITLTAETDETLSVCVAKSSTCSKSSIRATMLNAKLSRTLE